MHSDMTRLTDEQRLAEIKRIRALAKTLPALTNERNRRARIRRAANKGAEHAAA